MKKTTRKNSNKRSRKLKKTVKRLAAYSAAAAATVVTTGDRSVNAAEVVWDIVDVDANGWGIKFDMLTGATTPGFYNSLSSQNVFYDFAQGKFRLHADDYGYIYGPAYASTDPAGALGFRGVLNPTTTGSIAYAYAYPISQAVSQARNFEVNGPWYSQYYAYLGMSAGQTGFVGIQFQIGMGTRYGWAQITKCDEDSFILHGFGYNSTRLAPSLPIETAERHECIPEPSSFMLLAAGAAGLAGWRRKRAA